MKNRKETNLRCKRMHFVPNHLPCMPSQLRMRVNLRLSSIVFEEFFSSQTGRQKNVKEEGQLEKIDYQLVLLNGIDFTLMRYLKTNGSNVFSIVCWSRQWIRGVKSEEWDGDGGWEKKKRNYQWSLWVGEGWVFDRLEIALKTFLVLVSFHSSKNDLNWPLHPMCKYHDSAEPRRKMKMPSRKKMITLEE